MNRESLSRPLWCETDEQHEADDSPFVEPTNNSTSNFLQSPPRMRRQLHPVDSVDTVDDANDGGFAPCPSSTPNNNNKSNASFVSSLHEPHEQHQEENELPWYRNSQQVSAMISNFSTSYNVVNISLVLPILRAAVNAAASSSNTEVTEVEIDDDAVAAVASSLLAGMMVGQVLGGALGDLVGPNVALQGVMIVQVLASLGSMTGRVSNTTTSSSDSPSYIFWYLAAWRFALGVGAGGVYPLAAVLSAAATTTEQHRRPPERTSTVESLPPASQQPCDIDDDATTNASFASAPEPEPQIRLGQSTDFNGDDAHQQRNNTYYSEYKSLHRVVLTFSMQGLGFITVPLVTVPLLYVVDDLDVIWRIILGLGSVPGMILLFWKVKSSYCDGELSRAQRQILPSDDTDIVSETLPDDAMIDRSEIPHSLGRGNREDSVGENGTPAHSGSDHAYLISEPDIAPNDNSDHVIVPNEHRGWWESVRTEDNLVQKLLGTAATWFLFDVLFYGNTLFQPIVIEAAFGARENAIPIHLLQRTAVNSLALTSIALPGYAVAGLLLGKKTRWCYCGIEQTPRFVMLQGFTAMMILYFTIGSCWTDLRRYPPLLIFLYSLTFFFANYGPNTATFVLPSLVYSPECRSTFNGLCAAAGKLGALTGASLFAPAANRFGDANVMLACALIAGVSLTITNLFVPRSLGHPTVNTHHQFLNPSGQEPRHRIV